MTFSVIPKQWDEPVQEGDYYFNVSPFEDEMEALNGWKFSISGPTNNGPTLVRFLLLDKDMGGMTIHQIVNIIYADLVKRWPQISLVCRAIY